MTKPEGSLVSVVIPAYDATHHVGRAVASVRRQTYSPVEIIVVDNGSTDDTSERASEAGATRVVRIERNVGPSTARNIGTAAARGKLIAYLDADDETTPDKLERQVARLADEPKCDCVLTNQRLVLDHGAAIPPWLLRAPALLDQPSPYAISMLMPSSTIVRSGGFDPSRHGAEDIDLLLRIRAAGGEIAELPEALVIRHIHGDNASYDEQAVDSDLIRAVAPLTRRRPPPLVSAIIPVRDGAAFLAEALASVRSQSGVDPSTVEIVVVDDGSTDGSADVARRAQVGATVVQQPPLGPGVARNHGVLLSRGRHLAFLDADDMWTPTRLRTQLDLLDGGIDAVFGRVEEFVDDAANGLEWEGTHRPRATAVARLPSAMVIRRDAFARVGMFTADSAAPDAAVWYAQAVEAGLSMADADEVVLRRRLHRDNHSLRAEMAQSSYPAALKQILDRRRRAGP